MMVTEKLNQKRTMRFCSVVLMLALCVSLFAGCAHSGTQSNENAVKAGILLSTVYEDVLYIADPDGNVHTANFYGEVYYEQTSMDGYKYIAVDDDDYTLLYFNGEDILTLASNVAVAAMSTDGNIVAYITVTDEDNNISELRLYADGEETVIDTGTIVMCAVSPDGSAVGYTTEDEDGNYRTYYWNGTDNIHEIGKYRPIIAISNGGEYVYYAQLDDNGWTEGYYVQHGDDSASKVKMADAFSEDAIYFNCDGSELLFSDGENTYIFAKGEKRFVSPNEVLAPQFPEGVVQCRSNYIGVGVITYNIDSFTDHYYLLGEVLYNGDFVYLDQDYNAVTILPSCNKDSIYICADGKAAYFCIGASREYANADPEVANAWAEENYGYGIGTYRIHSDKLEEEPACLYEKPWVAISDNENIHYFESIEDIWNEEMQAYCASRVYYKVDVSEKNPQPVKLKTEDMVYCPIYDEVYNRVNPRLVYNPESSIISEESVITAKLNGRMIYRLDGMLYCYDGTNAQLVNGLDDWYKANNNGQIIAYENVFIAFTSEETMRQFLYDNDNSGLNGCYFSIDGVNFMPLVENYVSEKN